ncbi:MAG: response regulator [Armatimonadetes bacterium]|nr:response regulator [Armatimonadota bacterium]
MPLRSLRVLLVEDNLADVLLVQDTLAEMVALSPQLVHVESLTQARQALQNQDFDVVFIDLTLPDGRGLGNFECLHTLAPQTPMIVLTGQADHELALEALKLGAADYLIKGATDVALLERSTRYAIERKKSENDRLELARAQIARDEAQANVRAKDEFLATLSHELRTPLNAIMGWASLLKTGRIDEETTAQALDTIERSARMQAQLIEDLLDVSRIIAGNFRLEIADIDLAAIVRAAADTMQFSVAAGNVSLHLDLPPFAPLRGDAMRLQQVAWNLLSNAVKFTPEGGRVTVEIGTQNGPEGKTELVLRVSDTGMGIAPEFLPQVFERFRQADGTTTRRHGGLGLGLAIVQNVVELHGGRVLAQSNGLGQGATFSVFLRLEAVSEAKATAELPGEREASASEE